MSDDDYKGHDPNIGEFSHFFTEANSKEARESQEEFNLDKKGPQVQKLLNPDFDYLWSMEPRKLWERYWEVYSAMGTKLLPGWKAPEVLKQYELVAEGRIQEGHSGQKWLECVLDPKQYFGEIMEGVEKKSGSKKKARSISPEEIREIKQKMNKLEKEKEQLENKLDKLDD